MFFQSSILLADVMIRCFRNFGCIGDYGSSLHDEFIITWKLIGGKLSWFGILQFWEFRSTEDVMDEEKSNKTFLELISTRGKS